MIEKNEIFYSQSVALFKRITKSKESKGNNKHTFDYVHHSSPLPKLQQALVVCAHAVENVFISQKVPIQSHEMHFRLNRI